MRGYASNPAAVPCGTYLPLYQFFTYIPLRIFTQGTLLNMLVDRGIAATL